MLQSSRIHALPALAPRQTLQRDRAAEQATATPSASASPPQAQAQRQSLSCVIPCHNEEANLRVLLPQLEAVMQATGMAWEIVVVDDGSTDQTTAVAREWCQLPEFRCITLSRNFGKEAALTAGLQAAVGDAVILLDGDMQHSPELIPAMLEGWRQGNDVVYAVRQDRHGESAFKRWGTRSFYKLVNASDRFTLAENAGDFRLMDRQVVDALLSLPERNRFMKGLYAWVGFKSAAMPYTPAERAGGQTHYGTLRLLSLAVDGLTSFTTWPLRLVSALGLAFALPALGYGGYLTIEHWWAGNPISGWTTIVVSLMFFIGVQMISIGILGEYIARIFEEVKGRPLYLVKSQAGRGLGAGGAG